MKAKQVMIILRKDLDSYTHLPIASLLGSSPFVDLYASSPSEPDSLFTRLTAKEYFHSSPHVTPFTTLQSNMEDDNTLRL